MKKIEKFGEWLLEMVSVTLLILLRVDKEMARQKREIDELSRELNEWGGGFRK